jgi:hypothetical protein
MEQLGQNDNTVLERIFPWTQSCATIRVSTKTSHVEVMNNQTSHTGVMNNQTNHNDTIPTIPEKSSEKKNNLQSNNDELIVNNKQQYTSPDNQKAASVFEMWNVIESVGIKRDMLNKVITSDEAVTELYHVIENRIHYEREQEMIRRLKQHVTKLNEFNKTKKGVIKEVTV